MATKKTPTPLEVEFNEIKQLLLDLNDLIEQDDDQEFSSFAGRPYLMFDGEYFEVGDDYNGQVDQYGTFAEAKTFLTDELAELRKELGSRVENIDGNYDYNANVTSAGIKVGCTTISFEKFDEIAAKVAEVRPKPVAIKAAKKPAKKTTSRTRKA